MTPEYIADLSRELFLTALIVAAPGLVVGLLVGLLVSLAQAVTQINEMTLSFIPKIAAIGAAVMLGTPWMLGRLAGFAQRMLQEFPGVVD